MVMGGHSAGTCAAFIQTLRFALNCTAPGSFSLLYYKKTAAVKRDNSGSLLFITDISHVSIS